MPNYLNVDRNRLIEPGLVQSMITLAENPRDKAIIALLYITGARPIEALMLMRGDVDLTIQEDEDQQEYVEVKLYSAKKQNVKSFSVDFRTMKLYLSYPFVNHFLAYAEAVSNLNAPLFPITRQRLHSLIYKLSGNLLCPYNFRHNRTFRLKQANVPSEDIAAFRGDHDLNTQNTYIQGKAIPRKLVIK